MKLDDIKQQPKSAPVAKDNMTEQELRIFLNDNKSQILKYVQEVDKEHDALRIRFERDGFEKSLLAAQANIDQIIKYSEEALTAIKAEIATVDAGAKTALNYIGAKVIEVQTSNDGLKEVMKNETSRLTSHSREIVISLSEDARIGIEKTVTSLDGKLKEVVKTHQQIANTVSQMYGYLGLRTLGLWAWRWAMFMMLMKLCQYAMGIDGFFSWFKVWTGIAIF